jgi:hypothetical protein
MLVWILTVITAGATVNLGTYNTQSECVEQMAIMQPGPDSELRCSTLSYSIAEHSQGRYNIEPTPSIPMR